MTKDENNLFHANYKYMWNKLSTTYYHVKTGTPKASHIQGGAYLPAYSICSKCFKTDYEPSIGTVDSIVQFYNQNLSPQINTYQFLHEKLEKTDEIRYQTKTINDQRFIGKYYGYYLSTSGENLGAVLQVYEDNDILKAVMITGIRNNEELFGNELADIFSNTPGMHAFACTLVGFIRHLLIQLLMGKDLSEGINPSYKTFGYGGFFRYTLLFVVIHHVALFLIESLTLFDPLFLAIRIAASVVTTTLLICTIEAFNIGSQKSGD